MLVISNIENQLYFFISDIEYIFFSSIVEGCREVERWQLISSVYVLCFPLQQPPKKTSKREKPKPKATSKSKKSVKSANVKKADSSTTKKNQNSSKKGMFEIAYFHQLKDNLYAITWFLSVQNIGKVQRTLGKVVYWFLKLIIFQN